LGLFLAGCRKNDPAMPADESAFLKRYDEARAAYNDSKTPEKLAAMNQLVAEPHQVKDWVATVVGVKEEEHLVFGEKADSVWATVVFGKETPGQLFRVKISPDDAPMMGKLLELKKDQQVKFSGHSALKEVAEKESSEGAEVPVVFAVDQLTVVE
jgi:hypothetical protein